MKILRYFFFIITLSGLCLGNTINISGTIIAKPIIVIEEIEINGSLVKIVRAL